DADARFVIALKPGKDVKKYPLMPHTFKIIATEHFLGMEVGEQELDILAKIPNMSDWLDEQNGTGKYAANSLSAAAAAESQLKLMSAAIADPAAAGLEVDAGYKGTYRNLAFGNVAAVSDSRSAAPAAPAPMGLRALRAITQDTANIKVDYDGSVYTHFVAVPQGGNGYVLQLEGFGGSALTSADLRVFKPNGQALTVREVAGAVTAAQAESGYNAAVIDGVLTLSLADFKNADTTVSAAPVITVGGNTLPGVWQVVSDKPFKSSLVTLNAVPRVKSVELTDAGVLTATFENIGDTTGGDYYYDVTLERKGDPRAQALETPLTIAANESVVNSSQAITMDLTQLPVGNAAGDTYDISEIAASGDWYANVTLLQGGMETFNSGTENEIELLTTDFVDERYSATPYRVTSWLEALAWNANLQASSGGNQSIDVSFDPVASNDVPDGMVVSGYHVTVYDDATKLPASRRATDADGAQSVSSMEYNIPTSENDSGRYEYNIPEVPVGAYTVGAAPLYADLNPTVDEENNVIKDEDGNTVYEASPVLRRGAEVKTPAAITVSEANPPSLTFSVTGGNIVEENGLRYIFAGEKAALTAAATGGAAVTYYEFNGTPITSAQGALDAETLAAHTGKALIVSARNGQGDSATEYLTLYAGISAPLLVPDNYDPNNGSFTFTAYKNTGNYTVTGQADPGAAIGGAIADENGRFSFSGTLDSGADSEDFTLTAANAAGLVTMREINIVRGNVNENAGAPTPNGGTGGGGGGAQPPAAPVTVSRASLSYISGADRVLTSVAISRQGWESADAVILAPGGQNNLIDALAAAPLAGQENAPILLSTGTLDPAVVAEIQRLGAKKIYVVGAIGQDVIGALRAALPGVTVEILQGSNRFETAALVGAKLTNPQGTFVVGYNAVADAVSAASFAAANGYAIQIADPDGWFARPLPVADAGSATIGSIRESGAQPDSANGSASDDHDTTRVNPDLPVYILGGPTLVRDIAGATRLYGATRYETNKAIRDALAFEYTNIYTANGDTLVDALTGSALAAQTRAAIVLTPGNDPTGVDFGNITHETKVFAFGG
ncbi:MAG: cell wall-binding repeat-containing protein, partial [Gracilibacteraceae bacterium]|nr:cell wall-binding repeat-containing protein [Gracilibacteraceae bacterium]